MTLDDDIATGDQSDSPPLLRLTHTSTNADDDEVSGTKLSVKSVKAVEQRSSKVRANPTGGSLIIRSMLKRVRLFFIRTEVDSEIC